MKCRSCGATVSRVVCDLNHAPPSNSYLSQSELNLSEIYYPLRVLICESCWLMQIDEYKQAIEIFSKDYRYYSSYSSSWVKHASNYVDHIIKLLNLDNSSHVLEIASNDGYLLQFFMKKGIQCLGIDPAEGPANEAQSRGIKTIKKFFNLELAKEIIQDQGKQDLIIGNNVLAHVPDINGFVKALCIALKPDGTITLEFPHLLELIRNIQFDTIYHEHYSYISLHTIIPLFLRHGLVIYRVEQLSTHGGSIRIYSCHESSKKHLIERSVAECLQIEAELGLNTIEPYDSFQNYVNNITNDFLTFLLEQKKKGKIIVGYGAAAKGNTLINACGIKGTGLIRYVVDISPHKQGYYLPGSHIPIYHPDKILKDKPDVVIIFPWNIADEIINKSTYFQEWEGIFATVIPSLKLFQAYQK